MSSNAVILVTGGSGLVGRAIQHTIEVEPLGSRFGRKEGETWIFTGSGEADLRCVSVFAWFWVGM
jgi:GDP-L-fucose synthase